MILSKSKNLEINWLNYLNISTCSYIVVQVDIISTFCTFHKTTPILPFESLTQNQEAMIHFRIFWIITVINSFYIISFSAYFEMPHFRYSLFFFSIYRPLISFFSNMNIALDYNRVIHIQISHLYLSGIKSQLLVLDDVTIFDKIATWNEAKDICEKRGQLMLTLDSEEKLSVLTNRTSFVGLDL